MRRTTMTRGYIISMALLLAGGISVARPNACAAQALEANLHAVDAAAGRVSERQVGYVRFSPGKGPKQVNILIQIMSVPGVSGEEAEDTETSGHAEFEHALRLRSTGDCSNMKIDSSAIALPEVDVLTDGSATQTVTANNIAMTDLPGKSVVMLTGADPKKPMIMACGVIKKD